LAIQLVIIYTLHGVDFGPALVLFNDIFHIV